MSNLNDVYRSVEPELLQVEAEMGRTVQTVCPRLADAATYFLERSGKRIRPLITILTAKLGQAEKDIVVKVAAALELIHLGSLVHDDIVDEAELRRGRPSVNSYFGNTSAVLLGDFFFARALGLASEVGLEAVRVVSSVIGNLVEGELDQLERRFDPEVTVDDYFARIKRKTALFLAECCRMGGLFSAGNPLSPDHLYAYGLNLGLAFQVKDDLLDFSGQVDRLGKPVMRDLSQGVITLPVIHALEHHPRREEISAWIRSQRVDSWAQIRQCLEESGSLQYAEQRACQLIEHAKRQLDGVPEQAAKAALLHLADFVLSRVS
ncbi:MAG: polyprenyl synthetase family protein [Bacillota bacterium]